MMSSAGVATLLEVEVALSGRRAMAAVMVAVAAVAFLLSVAPVALHASPSAAVGNSSRYIVAYAPQST